jgi:phosphatidylglycerophosphate synthase
VRWPRWWLPFAGIVANLAIIAMYVVTRTSGIPLGPHRRVVETAGATDWLTTAAQVGIIVCLLGMLDGRARRWIINGLLALGVLAWVLRLTGHLQ